MFNFAVLPHEIILNMASAGKLTPKDMVRLIRTSRLFNHLIRDDSLWSPYLPENLRYHSNLFFRYSAFMQSDQVTPLVKFLVHKKGMTYDQALCVRIRDERVLQKVIREEITLDEARQMMTLSLSYRQQVLDNTITLEAALKLNVPSIERFRKESGFAEQENYQSVLSGLLRHNMGIQMLLEGLIDPSEYNQWTGERMHLPEELVENPYVLIALREGLVTGTQIRQMREEMGATYFIRVVFTEESLQAMRMGYITAQDAIVCRGGQYQLNVLKSRVAGIAANYFEQAGPVLIGWLKDHPDFTAYARILFNHVNGWKLYTTKILPLDDLLKMPSIEFLSCMLANDAITETLLAKQISIDDLLVLETANRLNALANLSGTYWLKKVIDRTVTPTMLASIECDFYQLDRLRWTYVSTIEHCGKSMTDFLQDANCELKHLVLLDRDCFDAELQRIVPEAEMQQWRNAEPTPEQCAQIYRYYVQAVKNLTCNMRMNPPAP